MILQRPNRIFSFGGVNLQNRKESSGAQGDGWEIAPRPNHCIMDINCVILTRNMGSVSHNRRWVVCAKLNLGTPVAMPEAMQGKYLATNMLSANFDAINYQIQRPVHNKRNNGHILNIEISGFGCA